MMRPLMHELAPLVEQITSPIGRFNPVADGVGKPHFSHLAGKVGGFRTPVAEG